MTMIRRLDDISMADQATCGGKAAWLGEALRLGCPVPPGVVLSTELYHRFMRQGGLQGEVASILAAMQPTTIHQFQAAEWAIQSAFKVRRVPEEIRAAVAAAIGELGTLPVVVRSSATWAGNTEQSFVGQHAVYLPVESEEAALNAVVGCWMSLFSAKALFYAQRFGVDLLRSAMAVLLQGLVQPSSEGALFTVDPITGNPDVFVLEVRQGRREGLHRLDPYRPHRDEAASWRDLRTYGLMLDEHFGAFMTLEWVLAEGRVRILRVRPATRVPEYLPVAVRGAANERSPLALVIRPAETPRRLSPYSWYHRSRSRELRLAYFERASWYFSEFAGREDHYLRGYLYTRWRPFALASAEGGAGRLRQALVTPIRLVLARRLDAEWTALWRERRGRLAELSRVDIGALSDEGLANHLEKIQTLNGLFLEQSGRLGDSPAILAGIFARVHGAWVRDEAVSADELLYTAADRGPRAERDLGERVRATADAAEREGIFEEYWRAHRHHYLTTNPVLESTDICAIEADRAAARALFERCLDQRHETPGERHARLLARRQQLESQAQAALGRIERLIYRQTLQLARRYGPLASDRFEPLCLGLLLEHDVVAEVGRRLASRGASERSDDGCLLGAQEVDDLLRGRFQDLEGLTRLLRERRAMLRRWQRYAPPPVLAGEQAPIMSSAARIDEPEGDVLRGRAVSRGLAHGPVRVVRGASEVTSVLPGEILVCPAPLFEFSPLFGIVSAVVSETGGVLDNAATLVREYGVPAVFGVDGATQQLRTGQTVHVDAVRGLVSLVRSDLEWARI